MKGCPTLLLLCDMRPISWMCSYNGGTVSRLSRDICKIPDSAARDFAQKENPEKVVPVGEMGRLAGVRWTLMSAAERDPYERLSAASKALYARLKTLTPEQRAAQEADPLQLQVLRRSGRAPPVLQ